MEVVQTPYMSYDEPKPLPIMPEYEQTPYIYYDHEPNFSTLPEFEQTTPYMIDYDDQAEFSSATCMINNLVEFSPTAEFGEGLGMNYDDQLEFEPNFSTLPEFEQTTPYMIDYADQPELSSVTCMINNQVESSPTTEFGEALGVNYDDQPKKKRKTQGRKKVEIKKIEKKSNRQVTFSKRRNGLFKKAEELCSLHGANVAVVTFSGAGKLFTNQSADVPMQHYVDSFNPNIGEITENNCNYDHFAQQYNEVSSLAEVKNMELPCGNNGGFWWNQPLDNLGLVELEHLKVAVQGLIGEVS